MKAVVCALVFLVLTVETPEFARDKFHTFMVYAQPLFKGNPLNLWDVCVGLVALAVALNPRTWRDAVKPLNQALVAALLMVALAVAWGGLRHGDLRMAYFQLHAFLRVFLLVPLLAAVFRSTRDLKLLAMTILAGAVYRAIGCVLAMRLSIVGSRDEWPTDVTGHDDSAIWAAAIVGLLGWLLIQPRLRTALVVGLLAPVILLAIHYNNRRLAWVEIAGSLLLLYLFLPRGPVRRRLTRLTLAVAPVLVLYVAVGWGRSGTLFAPVAKIRSVVADDNNASNLARDLEDMGLVFTLQNHRLLGTGFGQQYEEISMVYTKGMQRTFGIYRYIPHNSVLGLAAFTGLLGFPVIWAFMAVGAFLAARAHRLARSLAEQALAQVAFLSLFIYGQQAFGDMGFVSLKVNLLLACALAIAGRLAILTGAWPARRARSHGAVTRGARVRVGPTSAPVLARARTSS